MEKASAFRCAQILFPADPLHAGMWVLLIAVFNVQTSLSGLDVQYSWSWIRPSTPLGMVCPLYMISAEDQLSPARCPSIWLHATGFHYQALQEPFDPSPWAAGGCPLQMKGWQCNYFPPFPDLILSRPLWQKKKACRIFITLLLFRKNCLVNIAHNQEEKQLENSQSLLQMSLLRLVLALLHRSQGRWKKSPLCRQSLCKLWVCHWSMLVWAVSLLCSETKGCTASYLELASGLLNKPSYI